MCILSKYAYTVGVPNHGVHMLNFNELFLLQTFDFIHESVSNISLLISIINIMSLQVLLIRSICSLLTMYTINIDVHRYPLRKESFYRFFRIKVIFRNLEVNIRTETRGLSTSLLYIRSTL